MIYFSRIEIKEDGLVGGPSGLEEPLAILIILIMEGIKTH